MPVSRHHWPALLNLTGGVLAVLGLAFVAVKLYDYRGELQAIHITSADYILIIFLALVYGVLNFFLAMAWLAILAHLGVAVAHKLAVRIYSTSALAKYAPGNIFQFVSRQALGGAAHLRQGILLTSTFLEVALLCLSGGLLIPFVLPVFVPGLSMFLSAGLFASGAGTLVLAMRLAGARRLTCSIGCYLAFWIGSGLVFASTFLIFHKAGALGTHDIVTIAGCYVIACVVGLLAPGAPAGLGVREAVAATLLSGLVPVSTILIVAVVGRIITILGDVVFFVLGRTMAMRGAVIR